MKCNLSINNQVAWPWWPLHPRFWYCGLLWFSTWWKETLGRGSACLKFKVGGITVDCQWQTLYELTYGPDCVKIYNDWRHTVVPPTMGCEALSVPSFVSVTGVVLWKQLPRGWKYTFLPIPRAVQLHRSSRVHPEQRLLWGLQDWRYHRHWVILWRLWLTFWPFVDLLAFASLLVLRPFWRRL